MSKNFWTSDTHFGHNNILKYCNRPFSNVYDHDETILDNINSMVGVDDHLYHIGDFCMGNPADYLDRIKCRNIHFVVGSHDKQMWRYKGRFVEFSEKIASVINGQLIVMTHCAHLVWEKSHYGSWHLFGHSHGKLGNSRDNFTDEYKAALSLLLSRMKALDVGVDTHNFLPYSEEELKEIMDGKEGFLVNRDER